MNAYKCDICGFLFTQRKFNVIDSNSKDGWAVRLSDDINYADICPECVESFQKVIDNRTNINDTEV